MKRIVILALLFAFTKEGFSQKASVIDTLKYDEMINKQDAKKFKNGMDINIYVASDQNSYSLGDTLILGEPTGEGKSAFRKKRNFEYMFYGKPAGAIFTGVRNVKEDYKMLFNS